MKTTTARTAIATELMRDCPEDLVQDHEEIAQEILSGKSFQEICDTTHIEEYTDTYIWVKTMLGEEK